MWTKMLILSISKLQICSPSPERKKNRKEQKVKEYHIRTKKVAGKTTNKVNSLMHYDAHTNYAV